MLLNLTYQELERVEGDIKAHIKNKTRIEEESKTIKLEKEDIQVPMNFFMILFFSRIFFKEKSFRLTGPKAQPSRP